MGARDASRGAVYSFEGGFPTAETVQRAYDDADLNRAVQAYRFFFPTVSGLAIFRGSQAAGVVTNRVFGTLETEPEQLGFTLNSDTPYGPLQLDLRDGPMVIELPPGPLICAMIDLNQRWVADMGVPGPDAGEGGKHLLLPPRLGGRSSGRLLRGAIHHLPGDRRDPLPARRGRPQSGEGPPHHHNGPTARPPRRMGTAVVGGLERQTDGHHATGDRDHRGVLAGPARGHRHRAPPRRLPSPVRRAGGPGHRQGAPFAPDERTTGILEQAARIGNGQMRVQAFADRRPDRVVWVGKQWEWAALGYENGDFYADGYLDVDAREKWFYQAIAASPAMFRRSVGAGSLYWLGLRDGQGAYLDGGRSYQLAVPQPVPAKLFWSVTVYDAGTRSQNPNRSGPGGATVNVRARRRRPQRARRATVRRSPPDQSGRWIKTVPGKGWFVYFRIYGPDQPAFDGSWQLPDIEVTG